MEPQETKTVRIPEDPSETQLHRPSAGDKHTELIIHTKIQIICSCLEHISFILQSPTGHHHVFRLPCVSSPHDATGAHQARLI